MCVCVALSSMHSVKVCPCYATVTKCMLFCACVHIPDSNCSSTVLPPPFTNICSILSERKGPVSFSFLSSDTLQTSKGEAKGLMMPLLKAKTSLYGMTGLANYLPPSPTCHSGGRCLLCICLSHCCFPLSVLFICISISFFQISVLLPVHQMPSVCSL